MQKISWYPRPWEVENVAFALSPWGPQCAAAPPPRLQYQDLFIPIKHKEKGLYI